MRTVTCGGVVCAYVCLFERGRECVSLYVCKGIEAIKQKNKRTD